MISTFWNLCRTCPIPAESKLHAAEYKSNFPWQPNLPNTKSDVVVKPPDATSLEPALSRKKKHPEVAYRTNEVLGNRDGNCAAPREGAQLSGVAGDPQNRVTRAEERNNKSKVGSRSRSADPSLGRGRHVMNKEEVTEDPTTRESHTADDSESNALEDGRPLKATEYRAAFAWPPKPALPPEDGAGFKQADVPDGHSSRRHGAMEATVDHIAQMGDSGHESRKSAKRTEYKAKFKPFSSYMYVDGSWKKPKAMVPEAPPVVDPNSWYTEVVERLQKADEYRCRSRASAFPGGDQLQRVYSRQGDLWSHVDANASLAALALAQTPRKPPRIPSKTPPKEKPTPTSIYRSASAKRKENAEAESAKAGAASEKRKESPTKAVSPMKVEARGVASAKASPPPPKATPPMQRSQRTTPKVTGKQGESGETVTRTPTLPRRRATSSPPQRRTAAVDADKKGDKKTVSSKPRPPSRPLQESAAPPAAKPRAVVRPASAVTTQDGKIWLKPEGKKDEEVKVEDSKPEAETEENKQVLPLEPEKQKMEADEAATEEATPAETPCSERKSDAVRPSSLPPMNGSSASSSVLGSSDLASPSPLPEPQAGPVPLTTVKSPEEMTGVKSPDPETWTVPLDTGRGLEWTDGQTAGDWSKVRSPPLGTTPTVELSSKAAPVPANVDPVIPEGKVEPMPHVALTNDPVPLDTSNMKTAAAAGGDVLDKARNRLEEFWVTGK
ncbi:serine/arginine repetitive matrix protein 1-like isoform X2 [Ornithodoros turicata]|uniref:serine/arginine repetitive matrix protein 1-like isoform X2 n=1 Tax=Ornithodoros turicata TaxID=34597 RepID=UPI003138818F